MERARKEALAAYQEAAKLAGPGEGEADHHAAMLAAASDALRLAEEHVARAIEKEPALARQMLDDEGRKDDPLRALRGRERFEKLLEPAREQRTD